MTIAEQIRQRLKEIASEVGPAPTMIGEVVSYDEDAKTCVLQNDDIEIYDVRLRPVINGNQAFTIYPSVGTYVLAVRIESDQEWMVIGVDKSDKIVLTTDNTTIELKEGVLIQRGADTLKQIVTLIIEAVQTIIVIEGTNPDRAKLTEALDKANNLLR